jgi:hypothetical protein
MRAICRLSSTPSTFGLELLLMKKFMDLEASSPRTAERKVSIRELSLLRKLTQLVLERNIRAALEK